jgi:protein O-mannosyl-transferase
MKDLNQLKRMETRAATIASKQKISNTLLNPQRAYLLTIGIFAIVALLLYLNSFYVPWQFDDRPNIVNNPSVHFHTFSMGHFSRLLAFSFSESIRLFSYFTFALNFYFGGLNVFGYHLVNLLIHIVTGILVFWFIHLTLSLPSQGERYGSIGLRVAFLAGLIFIAHPVQTQSVTYIVQRMSSMGAMFYLLSMVLFIKGRLSSGRRRVWYYGGMVLSGFLSVFSKENGLMLPLFIVLYEICFFRVGEGFFQRSMVRVLLILVGLGLLGFILLGGRYIDIIREGYQYRDFTMSERGLTQFRVVLYYLTLLVFPHPSRLNLDYDFLVSKSLFNPPSTFFSLVVILFMIGVAVWRVKRWPILSFFIFWYFGNLVIESSIVPLEMVFEHRLYLPSVGPFFLFSLLLLRGWERWSWVEGRKKEVVFAGLVILILLPLSYGTINRNSVWGSEIGLWKDSVSKSPKKSRPHYNLGLAYLKAGLIQESISYCEKAVMLNPKDMGALMNLGVAYRKKGLFERAISQYETVLRIDPKSFEAHINLGIVYQVQGKLDEAISEFKSALLLNPNSSQVHVNLGGAYGRKGMLDEAILHFQKALSINPDDGTTHNNLALAYYNKKEFSKAAYHADRASRLGYPVSKELLQMH